MRLWTIQPRYLEAKGLLALGRKALLAQKVLRVMINGYRQHPQLLRLQATDDPVAAIATYLAGVHAEAVRRGYNFDVRMIGRRRTRRRIGETIGQACYEWRHLRAKLARRSPARVVRSARRIDLLPGGALGLRRSCVLPWSHTPAGVSADSPCYLRRV